jgi:hypothetical protein
MWVCDGKPRGRGLQEGMDKIQDSRSKKEKKSDSDSNSEGGGWGEGEIGRGRKLWRSGMFVAGKDTVPTRAP